MDDPSDVEWLPLRGILIPNPPVVHDIWPGICAKISLTTSAMISHLRRRSRVIHVSHGVEREYIVEAV